MTKTPLCLTFWYHMRGNGIGSLKVDKVNSQGQNVEIFEMNGHQGDQWKQAMIDILEPEPFNVRINNNYYDEFQFRWLKIK